MKYSKEQLVEIYETECLQNKMKYSEVKKKYDIPRGTWDYWIRKRLGNKADKRKYKANDHFFDSIDSEVKAYLLGFLYADGYLASDGRIGIRLKEEDIEILEMIQKYICPSNPIEHSNNQNFKRQPQCSIRWKSHIMYNRLKELGFCIDKTHTDSNIFQLIPEDMKKHFLRGYTDGDGHIQAYRLDNGTYRKISICWVNGCINILKDIQNWMPQHSWHLYDEKTFYVLGCYHHKEAYEIIQRLYSNATFFLTRKINQANKIFEFYSNSNTELTKQIA